MGVESPVTYGDWWWGSKVDADGVYDEQLESTFAPLFSALLSEIELPAEMPAGLRTFLTSLASPPTAGFGGFALGVGVEMVDETLHAALGPMMAIMQRALNRRSLETWLRSAEGNTLFRRGKIQEDFWSLITSSEGYDPINARYLYESQAPYPTIPDIMLWSRYHGDWRHTRDKVLDKFDVNVLDYDLWEWLTLQRLTTEQVQTLYKREKIPLNEFFDGLGRIGWADGDHTKILELGYLMPNAMLLTQGSLIQNVEDEKILKLISMADIHPDYARTYLDAIMTKPSTGDIIAYMLRFDPDLSNLPAELRKVGIHPDYHNVYKTLAYPIPPTADLITMAVREAFSPDIARRFGQYEDFPPDFEKYAGMKGLSKEWAERYWASHWNLPSPQQGFEMLHRGVIDRDTLDILLRALDVMPYWRDKLTEIAYRPLTRVDVRRMYREGVLDEREVVEAYLDAGYSERNAERMAEFTVKQTLSTQSKFTSGDIVKAFTQRMIDRDDAMTLLGEIGIKYENATYILNTAEYKRQWELTEQKIKAIKNLYKRKKYTPNETRDKLSQLDLPAEQIDVLMEQWYYEIEAELSATWTTAQTLSFLKKGLIDEARAREELTLNNYDEEHINIYLESLT